MAPAVVSGQGVEGSASGLKAAAAELLADAVESDAEGFLARIGGRLQGQLADIRHEVRRADADEPHGASVVGPGLREQSARGGEHGVVAANRAGERDAAA